MDHDVMDFTNKKPKDRIIVDLNVDTLDNAKSLVESLVPYVGCFLVRMKLIISVGAPQAVEFIHSLGGNVLLDGNFNGSPDTVAGAVRAAAELGVKMLTVHASAGLEAMMAAVSNRRASSVLVVTDFTSLDEANTFLIFGGSRGAKTLQFAHDAKIAHCEGIICSTQELKLLEKASGFGNMFMKVTPDICPGWAAANDQQIITPAEAIKAGATSLIIGRPITNPPAEIRTPVDAVRKIIDEITLALKERNEVIERRSG